jgi:hypothetical protein
MGFNKTMPNKIDLVLNREISLLVLLKNKEAEPDLFGIHSPVDLPIELTMGSLTVGSVRGSVMPTARQSHLMRSTDP